jgi:hypothetical protein
MLNGSSLAIVNKLSLAEQGKLPTNALHQQVNTIWSDIDAASQKGAVLSENHIRTYW